MVFGLAWAETRDVWREVRILVLGLIVYVVYLSLDNPLVSPLELLIFLL